MSLDHITPELALVDPDLAARARPLLPDPAAPRPRSPRPLPQPTPPMMRARPYPVWARVTASLWLVVLGILIGGAAIPHAQDKPRVVPAEEDPSFCPAPGSQPEPEPGGPGR